MLGSFTYHNPVKLYFGENAVSNLKEETSRYGGKVLLVYGGGSVKKNGVYDAVVAQLKAAGKEIAEVSGVMPNPTLEKLYEGIAVAREFRPDLILAVGGGSVCDYAKAVSISVNCPEDPWDKYFIRFDEPDADLEIVPVGCVLTMVGTGSEMNAGTVITNRDAGLKYGHVFRDARVMPKFSVLDPRYTMSLPHYQMVSGIYDIFNHISEQYFSGSDDCTSDYLAEGLMRSLIHASRIANKDPQNYEARSNIMWTATWALNTLISRGKTTDWMVHQLGQAVGALTDAAHGMTLSAVSLPYYRFILESGLPRFVRFATEVWGVDPENKPDIQIAHEGLDAMEQWMKELGLVMNITDLGATPDMVPAMISGIRIKTGGYRTLTPDEIAAIYNESF
ncbi:MAG: iron-containing alcohol dehydrogenase [Clostridia bacterium]|nr:iron-containing alcohol dehydrogenase [Clostridia bacterium]